MNEVPKIDITPEMIKAGVRELQEWHDELRNWDGAYNDQIVTAILGAALSKNSKVGPETR